MRTILLLILYSYTILVECIIPLNILLSTMDQFKLNDIIIQKNCFTLTMKRELFKIFADREKMINLNEKIVHPNHAFLRCPETLRNLTLNKLIKKQTVVFTHIENENELNAIDISIGEEVYFLDKNSFKIYEAYSINDAHVIRYLGQFHQLNTSSAFFSPADNFIDSLEYRRSDFHGIQLNCVTATWHSNIIIPDNFADQSNYFPENETYDVTSIVSGTYIDVLHNLEKSLNFSTKVYKRKDGVWGVPKTLQNGTIILNGIMKSITESHVDMICASLGQIQSRISYVDFLVPMNHAYASLFIANSRNFDIIDWSVYLSPFSIKIWLIIIASAITFMIIMVIMDIQHNRNIVSYNFSAKKGKKFF